MSNKNHDAGEPTLAELQKRALKARSLIAEARALFPEAHAMAKNDRRRSQGKLGADESKVLRGVLGAVDAEPAMFASLADEDEGNDPKVVETDLLRDRFDRHDVYAQVSEEIAAVAGVLSDHALTLGAQVKPVTLAAYEIAKPISKRNAVVREKIAPALDYYGANAAAAVASRKANQAAKKPTG